MFELVPLQGKTLRRGEVALDTETGLLMYRGKFDRETGTIMEPQLLFNSSPSVPFEVPSKTPEKRRVEATPTTSGYGYSPLLQPGWRNPKYQALRYVYIKNYIIVDHEGVSCGTPGATRICLGNPDEYMLYMRDHIKRLGADTVYMIHNHCAGDPTPSEADIAATAYVFSNIPQLVGHIIINSGKYAFIVPDGSAHTVYPLPNLPPGWTDPILTPTVDHYLLGRAAKTMNQIAVWAKAMMENNGVYFLIYLDDRLRVRGMQTTNAQSFSDKTLLADRMPQKLIDFGSNGAVAILPGGLSDKMLSVTRELVRSHILWAAVGNSKTGAPFGFAAEMPNPNYLGGRHRSAFAPYYIR